MSLSGAAAAMGLPESLVQRSAEARAAETGASVDEILAAWAGGEAPAAPEPAEPEVAEESTPDEPEAAAETTPDTEPQEPVAPITAPTPTEPAEPAAAARAPVPTEVTAAQAAGLPEVITVPTAGIRERTDFAIPKWLTAVLLIAPLFALFALGGSATGACGEGTELGIDVVSGEIVNCDGSEFTGGGVGGGTVDFVGLGSDIYGGGGVAGVNCAGCHGSGGQGVGQFPAMSGVLTTFGACADHVEWVLLGSQGFQGRGDTTYGDTGKPIGGGMPAFANSLTEEQLAAVVAFERVRFGGADPEETLVDCGLVEPEGEEPVDGEPPVEGDDGATTATTTPPDMEASASSDG